jgi:uncharacterized phiE125 gp8 family phage protein
MIIKRIAEPSVEILTASEVKIHTHISHSVEDSLISSWIKSGRIAIERFINRSLIEQTYTLWFDRWPIFPVDVPRQPLISLTGLSYYDSTGTEISYDIDNLIVDTISGRVSLAYGVILPSTTLRPINAIEIEYKAGYGTTASAVPESIKDALYIYCTWRNENRAGEVDVPKAFYDLLRPLRIVNV